MAKNKEIVKYAVSIGDDLWNKVYSALKEKYPMDDEGWITSKYRIVGIYEEGGEKFAVVEEIDGSKKFKIVFELTETELTLGEDLVEVKVDFVPVEMEMFTVEEFATYEESVKTEEIPVDMGCGDGEKEKMAELEVKLSEAEDKIAKYEIELAELKRFKDEKQMAECQQIVENTLSIAKKVVDETKYSELETESKECVYATVDEWSTKVLASVSKMAIAKMEEVKLSAREDDVMDMGIPTHVEKTKTSIYD